MNKYFCLLFIFCACIFIFSAGAAQSGEEDILPLRGGMEESPRLRHNGFTPDPVAAARLRLTACPDDPGSAELPQQFIAWKAIRATGSPMLFVADPRNRLWAFSARGYGSD